MKIRLGFVSNSSSSSFIIAYKGDLKEELNKVFKPLVIETYPIKEVSEISDTIFQCVDKTISTMDEYQEYLKDGGKQIDDFRKLHSEGFSFACGRFYNNTGEPEQLLCYSRIWHETDTLIFHYSGAFIE